ncbi:hypothetical protein [Ancylobacter radicis]|uniref:Uncharacterized protein n=1 Tax=Ancylobacter radicis TaxID=2836179 RepID=A0ABS5R431_9HYPH|nr:hypothetical protein [Ancylobacter radicis]MBS9476242.1 hypothetical protein [Ancylobacter radicis]
MKAALYVLVGVTCLAALGFMAAQLLRQHRADTAAEERARAVRQAVLAYDEQMRCEGVLSRARSFSVGSSGEIAAIESQLKSCGLSLSDVRR